jgi:hypothetical protein
MSSHSQGLDMGRTHTAHWPYSTRWHITHIPQLARWLAMQAKQRLYGASHCAVPDGGRTRPAGQTRAVAATGSPRLLCAAPFTKACDAAKQYQSVARNAGCIAWRREACRGGVPHRTQITFTRAVATSRRSTGGATASSISGPTQAILAGDETNSSRSSSPTKKQATSA